MFLKPFRVKSNSQMKSTERKALKTRLYQSYPNLVDNDLESLFTNKDAVSSSKIITHSNQVVILYLVNKRPMLFQIEETLYPTIFYLWKVPDLLRCLTTHEPVIPKLKHGADLMIPGVVVNDEGMNKFGRFEKNTLMAVNITTNKAPQAIGTTAHDNLDMYMAGGRGKFLNIIHVIGDSLCQMEGKNSIPSVPELGTPEFLIEPIPETEEKTEDSSLDSVAENAISLDEKSIENEDITEIAEGVQELTVNTAEEMDNLLIYCFLKALKYSGKKITLPILTSNFYRLHIIEACPSGKTLDIKKTSYKKLNKFLNEMKTEGLINVVEQTKGVETITTINFEHSKVGSFVKNRDDVKEQVFDSSSKNTLAVEENYTVTAAILPILADAGFRKGDVMKPGDVRKHVIDYVKKKKLNSLESRNLVIPNKELCDILKSAEEVTWEELMTKIFSVMSSCYKINSGKSQVSGKGKLELIILSVATRTGNKKVTFVNNLELFGINAADFGKECQHGVAASTSVSKPPGKKCEQLLIQGNQVAFVGKLLTEKYKIPKRFIRGLELAVKNKK